jgi:C4-dicarboxylate transporter DctM subunit
MGVGQAGKVCVLSAALALGVGTAGAQAPDVKITSIYRGIIPFLIAPLILIVLLFLFPGLALWLPKALYG